MPKESHFQEGASEVGDDGRGMIEIFGDIIVPTSTLFLIRNLSSDRMRRQGLYTMGAAGAQGDT